MDLISEATARSDFLYHRDKVIALSTDHRFLSSEKDCEETDPDRKHQEPNSERFGIHIVSDQPISDEPTHKNQDQSEESDSEVEPSSFYV